MEKSKNQVITMTYCQCGGANFKPVVPKDYEGKVCTCKDVKPKTAKFESIK